MGFKGLGIFWGGMTGMEMTGNRQSLRHYKNDRDYDRGFVWVSTENLSWKEHYYNYLHWPPLHVWVLMAQLLHGSQQRERRDHVLESR